jgi:hypothetical protein
MNPSAPEHLFAAERLISTFFRESERELSRLTQSFSSNPEGCGISNVAEVIHLFFFFQFVEEGIYIDLPPDRLVHKPNEQTSLVASNPPELIGPS